MAGLRDFLLGTEESETTTNRERTYGRQSTVARANMEELAKAVFFAREASTIEEVQQKLEEYFELQEATVVKVYLYGPGPSEFFTDKEDAEMMAGCLNNGFKVRAAYAREIKDKMVLLTPDELKAYFKKKQKNRR